MELKLSREFQNGNPTLGFVIIAEEDEKEIFTDIGFDKIASSDQLFQKFFNFHEELFSAINIPRQLFDTYHAGDNQFSNACKGFGQFLRNITDNQLDKINDTLIQKISQYLSQRDSSSTLTSIRVIMLSATKRLPVTTFNLEDPNMRLQIGNQVYSLNPNIEQDQKDVIDTIRSSAKETIDASREFFQVSNQRIILQVEQGYKEEIERIRNQYINQLLFPRWLGITAIFTHKIRVYHAGEAIAFVLPFKYNLIRIRTNNHLYNLKEKYQEDKDVFIQLHVQRNRFAFANLVNPDFSHVPTMHTLSHHQLCLGSYNFPREELNNLDLLIKVRDGIQNTMQTGDISNLGNEANMNELHKEILRNVHERNLEGVADAKNPIAIHDLGYQK